MLLCPAQDPYPLTSSAFDIQPSTLPWPDDPGSPGAWILLLMNHQKVNSLKLCHNAWHPSPHFISSHGHLTIWNHKNSACVLSSFSRVQLCNYTDCSRQAPLSMGFSRQEYWSGLPCPPPGVLPDTGIRPMSLVSPALAGGFFTTSAIFKYSTIKYFERERSHSRNFYYSPSGSSVHGILQARILQLVAIYFSRESSWHRDWTWVFCIAGRFSTIWATREAPLLQYIVIIVLFYWLLLMSCCA